MKRLFEKDRFIHDRVGTYGQASTGSLCMAQLFQEVAMLNKSA